MAFMSPAPWQGSAGMTDSHAHQDPTGFQEVPLEKTASPNIIGWMLPLTLAGSSLEAPDMRASDSPTRQCSHQSITLAGSSPEAPNMRASDRPMIPLSGVRSS